MSRNKPCVTTIRLKILARTFCWHFVNVPFLASSVPDLKLDLLSICKSNKNKSNGRAKQFYNLWLRRREFPSLLQHPVTGSDIIRQIISEVVFISPLSKIIRGIHVPGTKLQFLRTGGWVVINSVTINSVTFTTRAREYSPSNWQCFLLVRKEWISSTAHPKASHSFHVRVYTTKKSCSCWANLNKPCRGILVIV